MRKDGIIKPSSIQHLCLFCQSRLAAQSTLISRWHTRPAPFAQGFSTSRHSPHPFGEALGENRDSSDAAATERRLLAAEREILSAQEPKRSVGSGRNPRSKVGEPQNSIRRVQEPGDGSSNGRRFTLGNRSDARQSTPGQGTSSQVSHHFGRLDQERTRLETMGAPRVRSVTAKDNVAKHSEPFGAAGQPKIRKFNALGETAPSKVHNHQREARLADAKDTFGSAEKTLMDAADRVANRQAERQATKERGALDSSNAETVKNDMAGTRTLDMRSVIKKHRARSLLDAAEQVTPKLAKPTFLQNRPSQVDVQPSFSEVFKDGFSLQRDAQQPGLDTDGSQRSESRQLGRHSFDDQKFNGQHLRVRRAPSKSSDPLQRLSEGGHAEKSHRSSATSQDADQQQPRFRSVRTVSPNTAYVPADHRTYRHDHEQDGGFSSRKQLPTRPGSGSRSVESQMSHYSPDMQTDNDLTKRDTTSPLTDEPRSFSISRVVADDDEAPARTDRTFADITERTLRSSRFGARADRKDPDPRRGRRRDLDREFDGGFGGRRRNRDLEDEEDIDQDDEAAVLRRQRAQEQEMKRREKLADAAAKRAAAGRPIVIPAFITVSNLAQLVDAHFDRFVRRLESLGFEDIFASKVLDAETAALIAQEYGYNPTRETTEAEREARDLQPQPEPAAEDTEYWPMRPPVVTIMGHVDHGKTTILDFLRKANVAAGEAGGITQHIGAFSVTLPATERTITFLDTPGHAAFLAMRQRGANVTDIVVLVVAADDSIMPQTLEALKHARAAKVPIIVAINKVDKPEADVSRVKQDLARHDVEIEDFGGDVQVISVSGKTGQGMDALEEAIVTQSELLDYRADTEGSVDGWVIEATTKPAGRVATVLVRRGTLRPGCIVVAGNTWTRVRTLRNDLGKEIQEAAPGTPVEVDGWREQPMAGDRMLEAEDEQHAASVVDYRIEAAERKKIVDDTQAINDARLAAQQAREIVVKHAEEVRRARRAGEELPAPLPTAQPTTFAVKEGGQILLPFIIKADVSGSAEALAAYVEGAGTPLIAPKIEQALVGSVHESDIEYAAAIDGMIIAFNIEIEESIRSLAAVRKVKILETNIIYRAVELVRDELAEKLPPLVVQKVSGEAEIAMSFEISLGGRKKTTIAGCKVRNGVMAKNSRVRIMRGTEKVYDGSITSLKNVKKDVQEMRKGSECGIGFENWEDFMPGDVVQTYVEVSEKRSL